LSKAYFYEYIGKGNKCILNVPQTWARVCGNNQC
jgi:hypothetical protein